MIGWFKINLYIIFWIFRLEEKTPVPVILLNWFQTTSWNVVLILSLGITLQIFLGERTNQLESLALLALKVAQTSQALDLLFSLLKLTKTPFLTAFLQIFQRNLLTWFFFEKLEVSILINILIPWSLADSTRYLYYNFKDLRILGHIR